MGEKRMEPRSLSSLTSPAAQQRAGTNPLVLIPTGAVEQHGPHLPLGTDVMLAGAVASGVAERLGCSLADPLAYGCSWHHTDFAGTVSLRTSTFISLVFDVCGSLSASGFVPVLINGHHGNKAALQVALADLAEAGVRAYAASYFDLLADAVERVLPRPEASVGHACALETSLVLHLWPELVDREAVPTGGTPQTWPDPHMFADASVSVVKPFGEINPTGVIGRPEVASAERGKQLFESAVERCTEEVSNILQRLGEPNPTSRRFP